MNHMTVAEIQYYSETAAKSINKLFEHFEFVLNTTLSLISIHQMIFQLLAFTVC